MDVTAVVALPCMDFATLVHFPGVDAFDQLAVTRLVLFLDRADAFEQAGKLVEALLTRRPWR